LECGISGPLKNVAIFPGYRDGYASIVRKDKLDKHVKYILFNAGRRAEEKNK
jgi:hypothetical protein